MIKEALLLFLIHFPYSTTIITTAYHVCLAYASPPSGSDASGPLATRSIKNNFELIRLAFLCEFIVRSQAIARLLLGCC